MTHNKKRKIIGEAVAVLLSLIVLIPMYMVVINSFKDKADAADLGLSLPKRWHIIDNYAQLIKEGNILTAFKNSVVISGLSVVMIVVFSAMIGFIIQRKKGLITKALFFILQMGMIIPASMVPTYMMARKLELTGSPLGVIAVLTTLNLSVAVFLYVGYYKSIPVEIDESGVIDGCGPYRLFFSLIFPLLKPVTVTVIIISFMAVWNDFGTTIYFLNNPDKYTMVLTTFFFFGARSADWQLVFADVVLISLPVVVLYILLQRYIISGMVSGSVKG